jgi:hypothetical protein
MDGWYASALIGGLAIGLLIYWCWQREESRLD